MPEAKVYLDIPHQEVPPGFDPTKWQWSTEFDQNSADRKRILNRFSELLREGESLKANIPNITIEAARSDFVRWHEKVLRFLEEESAFGTAYVCIFRSEVCVEGPTTPVDGDEATKRLLGDVDHQLLRIGKWIERFED